MYGRITKNLFNKMTLGAQTISRKVLANKNKQVLPTVDFSLSESEFNKQTFNALRNKRGVVLNNFSTSFSSSTTHLFKAYGDFLHQPEDKKEIFKNKEDSSHRFGYYPYGNFLFGSKLCDRFFIFRDGSGNITHTLPTPICAKLSMQDAANEIHMTTEQILNKIISAMEYGFGLHGSQFKNLFNNHSTITVADRYLPITQEKLQSWTSLKKLTKTKDGRIEAFLPHKDLTTLSIHVYHNNNCQGLEVNLSPDINKKNFEPIGLKENDPYNIQAVIFIGSMMEVLTDSLLKAIEHHVIIQPMQQDIPFSRNALSTFFILDPMANPTLKPLLLSPDGPHFPSFPMASFIHEAGEIYYEEEKANSIQKLTQEELDLYPTENSIKCEETAVGSIYRRS